MYLKFAERDDLCTALNMQYVQQNGKNIGYQLYLWRITQKIAQWTD